MAITGMVHLNVDCSDYERLRAFCRTVLELVQL